MSGPTARRDAPVPSALLEQLRADTGRAESSGTLTPEQLAIIYDRRWFKLFVPSNLGGLELPLPEAVRLEEELARIDGSLGWTVTLCAGANLFVGYLDPSHATPVFSDPRVCLGGSGQATGKAIAEGGGYRVWGRWRYATGTPHLTHFTANCVVQEDGKDLLDATGKPLVRSFLFPRSDVQITNDWNTFGLKATASHSFAVDGLWVDARQAFSITPGAVTWGHSIYRYPFLPFAEATLAVNTLGMARHFLACAAVLGNPRWQALVENVRSGLAGVRVSFYEALDTSWRELLRVGELPPEVQEAVSESSKRLVKVARDCVVAVYPHLGLAGADATSEINRVWRDIFTASQHSLLRP